MKEKRWVRQTSSVRMLARLGAQMEVVKAPMSEDPP